MKPLLTMEQVCLLLTISRPTLTRWVRANKIPYVLLGSGATKLNVRFREEEIEAWIERRSRGPVPGGMKRKRHGTTIEEQAHANLSINGDQS